MKCIFISILIFYIFLCIKTYITQEKEIFHPEKAPKKVILDIKNFEKIWHKTKDSEFLEGGYVKNSPNNPLVIYFSGNSNNSLYFLNLVKDFKEFNFLTFNYRGFSNSSGKPSEEKIFSDALEIYDNYAKDKEVYLIGRSLGSCVATYLASKRDNSGVILLTPFDSILNIAKRKYRFLPMNILLKHKFETVKYIKDVKSYLSVIEVENEEMFSNEHTKNLLNNINNLIYHKILDGATHMGIFIHPDFIKRLRESLIALRRKI